MYAPIGQAENPEDFLLGKPVQGNKEEEIKQVHDSG
jgi:hypothetical protein